MNPLEDTQRKYRVVLSLERRGSPGKNPVLTLKADIVRKGSATRISLRRKRAMSMIEHRRDWKVIDRVWRRHCSWLRSRVLEGQVALCLQDQIGIDVDPSRTLGPEQGCCSQLF